MCFLQQGRKHCKWNVFLEDGSKYFLRMPAMLMILFIDEKNFVVLSRQCGFRGLTMYQEGLVCKQNLDYF